MCTLSWPAWVGYLLRRVARGSVGVEKVFNVLNRAVCRQYPTKAGLPRDSVHTARSRPTGLRPVPPGPEGGCVSGPTWLLAQSVLHALCLYMTMAAHCNGMQ